MIGKVKRIISFFSGQKIAYEALEAEDSTKKDQITTLGSCCQSHQKKDSKEEDGKIHSNRLTERRRAWSESEMGRDLELLKLHLAVKMLKDCNLLWE